MQVIITGASGFVASHLIPLLLDKGYTVCGIVRKHVNIDWPPNLKGLEYNKNLKIEYCDIRDFPTLAKIIEKEQPKFLFHLASVSFVPDSFRDPISTFMTNSLGTQNILEAIRLYSPKTRMIFAGTSEEYGLQFKTMKEWIKAEQKYGKIYPYYKGTMEEWDRGELPINEENPLRPMSPYAVSKVHGDYLCRNYYMTYGLDTVVSRAFNHEQKFRGREFVTAKIVRELVECYKTKRNVIRFGNPENTRDWSDVRDICDGYLLLAERAESGSVYVQGSGVETSIMQFMVAVDTQLRKMFGQKDIFVNWYSPEFIRPSDVPHLCADPTKIKKLGWKPKYNLQDIINDMIDYYTKLI